MLGYHLDVNISGNDSTSPRLMIPFVFRGGETEEEASGGRQGHEGQEEERNREGKEGERDEDRTRTSFPFP